MGKQFLPAFQSRAKALLDSDTTEPEVGDWIDSELRAYGPDARLLVGRAMKSYLASRAGAGGDEAILAIEEKLLKTSYGRC